MRSADMCLLLGQYILTSHSVKKVKIVNPPAPTIQAQKSVEKLQILYK
jgi:hypothetical protein